MLSIVVLPSAEQEAPDLWKDEARNVKPLPDKSKGFLPVRRTGNSKIFCRFRQQRVDAVTAAAIVHRSFDGFANVCSIISL
nr:hypothetical protein CFP56_31663 [Quercus suber]